MTPVAATTLALVCFLGLAATAGPRLLTRSAWVRRRPGSGVLAWQALALAVVSAVLLLGATLAAPLPPVAAVLAGLVGTSPVEVGAHYSTPLGRVVALLGALATGALVLRLGWTLARTWTTGVRDRRRQVRALRVLGRPQPGGYLLVDHPDPLVYCLPGRRGLIVVSTGARALLDPAELDGVLAHERTHLRARHDLALASVRVLRDGFGGCGLGVLAAAEREIATLVEMQADDAATDRRSLARALVRLGTAPRGTGAGSGGAARGAVLAAGDVAAVERVRRLAAPGVDSGSRSAREQVGLGAAVAVLLAAPVAIALIPMAEMLLEGCLS